MAVSTPTRKIVAGGEQMQGRRGARPWQVASCTQVSTPQHDGPGAESQSEE